MSKPNNKARAAEIWYSCQRKYLAIGKSKVLDVSEGVNGEDRVTFRCNKCGEVHENATVIRRS